MTSKANLPWRERGSSLTMHNGQLLFVRMKDPLTGVEFLTPPGGGAEPGESLQATAIRETLEETGYAVELEALTPQTLEYEFNWKGKVHACRTTFFLARLKRDHSEQVHDASYILGAVWVPLSEVATSLAYHPKIQRAVLACLGQRAP